MITPGKNFSIILTSIGLLAVLLQASFVFTGYNSNNYSELRDSLVRKRKLSQAQLLSALNGTFLVFAGNQEQTFEIDSNTLKSWIISRRRDYLNLNEYYVDKEMVKKFLAGLPVDFGSQPVSGILGIDENGNLFEEVKSVNGKLLNLDKSAANIANALENGNLWTEIAFDDIVARVSLQKAKELKITSLLGKGESNFSGSSSTRIQNIKIGTAVYNGLILNPGEEFSFNNILGPVDESRGYARELVVKDHSIMTEYGGGLCQVSTTIFRAAVNAGLKITERHNHSLPLKYYSPQGFDATIYPGISDLKFVNDTKNNILIQGKIKGNVVYFEIFGVSDGRQVKVDGPYTYEYGEGGAMKTTLTRTITLADGTQNKETFYSDYKNPALYPLVKNPLE